MKKINIYLMILLVAFLFGCESDPGDSLQNALDEDTVDQESITETLAINAESQAVGTVSTFSNYDPASASLPSSIDVLFSGSDDGTLNIPIGENDPQGPLKSVLNALDGFSTINPITTGFTDSLDPLSIGPSPSNPTAVPAIRMFEVGLSSTGGAVVAIKNELTYGVDFIGSLSSVDPTSSTLAIVPLKPLQPKTSYYVVITNSLKDTDGNSVGSSPTYTLLKNRSTTYVDSNGVSQIPNVPDETASTLELLRQLVSTSEFTVDFAYEDLAAINIAVSWSFTTQSVGDVLAVTQSTASNSSPVTDLTAFAGNIGSGEGLSPFGAARIHVGSIDVPYYLTAPTPTDPLAILTKHWEAASEVGGETNLTRFNPTPAETSTVSIPLLVTTPLDTSRFPAPWKTVIFQHGITTNRTVMLAVSDALANAGFAVLAIDMALHGVDDSSPFYQAGKERTFDVDFLTQDEGNNTTAAAPDGTVDSSGAHFINLSNLLVTRDNVRQSISDLFSLTSAVSSMDIDGDNTPDLNSDEIYFVGHSLGAMVGTTFVALDSRISDSVFAMGAGAYAKVLDGSAAFSPTIVAGLAAASGGAIDKNGVGAARAAYESFLGVAQAAVDTADPINFATAAVNGRGVLYFEIVGDGVTPGTSDQVVPNRVPDLAAQNTSPATVPAPLAGTEPLLDLMGLTQVNASLTGTEDLKVSVKFTSGDHSSILSPDADPAVTTEMQTEMASFLFNKGIGLPIGNDSIIQAP